MEREQHLRQLEKEKRQLREEDGKHDREDQEATVEVGESEPAQLNEEEIRRAKKAAFFKARKSRAQARADRIAELCSISPPNAREDFTQLYEEIDRAQKAEEHEKQVREREVTQRNEEIDRVEEASEHEKQVEGVGDEEAASTGLATHAEAQAADVAELSSASTLVAQETQEAQDAQEAQEAQEDQEAQKAAAEEAQAQELAERKRRMELAREAAREEAIARRALKQDREMERAKEEAELEAQKWRERENSRTAKVQERAQHVAELQGKELPTANEARGMTLLQLRETMWKAGLPVCGLPSAQEAKRLEPSKLKERLLRAKADLLTQLLWVLREAEENQDEGEPEEQSEEGEAEPEQQEQVVPGGRFLGEF